MEKLGATEVLLIAAVAVVVSSFGFSGAQAAAGAPGTSGFLYVDCGATTAQVDPVTGITWVPDTDYISTGTAVSVVPSPASIAFVELRTLRAFDNSLQKSCYTLPVTRNATYLLRLSFYHGAYDGSTSTSFDVGVDASILTRVTVVADTGFHYNWEYTIQPQRNVTFVCLMPTSSNNSNPFISGISLRAVSASILPSRILNLLAANQTIVTPWRQYLGPNTAIVRYPADVHDRLWLPMTTTSPLITATSPIEDVVSPSPVNLGYIPSYLDPPTAVLGTALTTSGNLTISLPPSAGMAVPSAYLAIYFLELDSTANVTDRQFHIHVPDITYNDRFENPLNSSGYFSTGDCWILPDMYYNADFSVVMYPNADRTSLRGPIVNALELSHTLGQNALPTNVQDMTAIEVIKSQMNLTGWGGDPCLPYPYPWLACTNSSSGEFDVISVNLSSYNLTGTISSAFRDLTHLTSLDLGNNYLVGVLPDLRRLIDLEKLHVQNNTLSGNLPSWLTMLQRLTELYVQNNNFSGPIPQGL